jgi:DNA-binding transcriptional LysR family regulator
MAGICPGGISTPRSPRATITASLAATIASRVLMPDRFSALDEEHAEVVDVGKRRAGDDAVAQRPAISRYVLRYPEVDVQLQLSVDPPALTEDQFDVCIRFGAPADTRVIARRLAPNRRLLCASPKYLAERGEPKSPAELRRHNCICIRQGDEAYGLWRLFAGRDSERDAEAVKVRGNLATNDGEIAVNWALDGHGILMRAEWDIERYLKSGRLVQVLPGFRTPDADIYAVYPQRQQLSARIRTFVEFLAHSFERFE